VEVVTDLIVDQGSGRLNFDQFGFITSGGSWQGYFKYTVFETGSNLGSIDIIWKNNGTGKVSPETFLD
jgi:hypothetical protein